MGARTEGAPPIAGWYADPGGVGVWRWWTGATWTERVLDAEGVERCSPPPPEGVTGPVPDGPRRWP